MNVWQVLKKFIDSLNERGIPLPMVRIKKRPDFVATMTWISFNTAVLGQIGKVTKVLGEVDLTQANYLFLICLGAYLGNKKLTADGTTVKIEPAEKKDEEPKL